MAPRHGSRDIADEYRQPVEYAGVVVLPSGRVCAVAAPDIGVISPRNRRVIPTLRTQG